MFVSMSQALGNETLICDCPVVRGKQIDPFGKETSTAVQIGWCLRKFVDAGSKSDVLDFSLSRSSLPPARNPPDSDDSD
jgi:hypothetical protein